MKNKYIFLLLLMLLLFMSGCYLFNTEQATGERDKTNDIYGSLINVELRRGDDWHQIVVNSMFQLGIAEEEEVWSPNGQNYWGKRLCYQPGTYPHLQGSTVCIPMGVEFARQHLKIDDSYAETITQFYTTAAAYEALIQKAKNYRYFDTYNFTLANVIDMSVVDVLLVTEPSDDELKQAREANIQLIIKPICWDAFVFITHITNPVNTLTIEQIQKIYTGEITNWIEVGGLDQEIIAYQREPNSGSQTTMEKRIMNEKPMILPHIARVKEGMGQLVDAVSEYKNEYKAIS